MTREEKSQVIQDLTAKLADTSTIYLADISGLDAQQHLIYVEPVLKLVYNYQLLKIHCFQKQWKLLIKISETYHQY